MVWRDGLRRELFAGQHGLDIRARLSGRLETVNLACINQHDNLFAVGLSALFNFDGTSARQLDDNIVAVYLAAVDEFAFVDNGLADDFGGQRDNQSDNAAVRLADVSHDKHGGRNRLGHGL